MKNVPDICNTITITQYYLKQQKQNKMTTLKKINAKELKKTLTESGVKVFYCYHGKGTTKNATYVTVAFEDIQKCAAIFEKLNIVSTTKQRFDFNRKCSSGQYSLMGCYFLG